MIWKNEISKKNYSEYHHISKNFFSIFVGKSFDTSRFPVENSDFCFPFGGFGVVRRCMQVTKTATYGIWMHIVTKIGSKTIILLFLVTKEALWVSMIGYLEWRL